MIQHRTARRIASEWHGGGGSGLYVLASTGAVTPTVEAEISDTLSTETKPALRRDLVKLRDYVRAHAGRGPVDGWGRMRWD